MPKISIITVNYNNLEGLQKTIESVSSQTWQAFEHIIIDGGSTDGTVAFLESKSQQFSYWISEPDLGVYHAMNKGIAQAKGKYLLFLNSGDHFYTPNSLGKSIGSLGNHELIYFNQNVVSATKTYIKEYPENLSFAYFLKDNLPHQATFIKKDLFDKVGMYKEDFKIVADWKFFIDSICKYNVSYLHVNLTMTTFYVDGISSFPENKKVIDAEKKEVLEADYLAYAKDLEDVLKNMTIINSLRRSRIIKTLIRFGFLNKF